ncbi:MAG: radical SAM protein [Myxococcota bacterium]
MSTLRSGEGFRVVDVTGRPDLAQVYLVQLRDDPHALIECVGALDPALPKRDKLVIVVSTQLGCAVGCPMCDAGTSYQGNLRAEEILAQVDHVLKDWAGPEATTCAKLKVQFARMGEPALNPAVLEALERLPSLVTSPGLMPCIATTAPRSGHGWFERLRAIRDRHYGGGQFQLQLSVQSTDEVVRDAMIPVPKWSLWEMATFCRDFVRPGDRKVTLNFAMARGVPISAQELARIFDPGTVLVKLTPLNPTDRAVESGLQSTFDAGQEERVAPLVTQLTALGFDCIVSVGLPEESEMRSSCGQLVRAHENGLPRRFGLATDSLEV